MFKKIFFLSLLPTCAAADVLIDVRTPEEYNAGHLEPAFLLPVQHLDEGIAAIAPDLDEPVYLYCRSGNRSEVARRLLVEKGYRHVYNLGGMTAAHDWLQAQPEVKPRAAP
ncbi:MAG: rhodanese-like domain-containing protein [Cardiobacteriaceae bacterium]|nr:rhodanese-like domain-containing protein [Cardiobacteriaceae bacterium]